MTERSYPSVEKGRSPDRPQVPRGGAGTTLPGNRKILEEAQQRGLLIGAYSATAPYLNFAKSDILKNEVVSYSEGLGIPLNVYPHLPEPVPYPVTIGLFALELLSRQLVQDDDATATRAQRALAWILANQDERGAWTAPFRHEFFKGRCGGPMEPGWPSALAQGYMLSALCRAFHRTADERLASAARLGLRPFEVPVAKGGVSRPFQPGLTYYEEYPTAKPSYVLNGFMFSLLGLYDVWHVLHSELARHLFEAGVATLETALPFYDLGDRTAYDLTHLQAGNERVPPNPARPGYHDMHVTLLSAISSVTGQRFAEVVERWTLYRHGVIVPNN